MILLFEYSADFRVFGPISTIYISLVRQNAALCGNWWGSA